jgi:hypothetical protein
MANHAQSIGYPATAEDLAIALADGSHRLRYATSVDDEIDYSQHTEPELVDMFGRLDPRYAPTECARLAKILTDRGYMITDGTTGPGSAAPSPEKMHTLIGLTSSFECKVLFGPTGSFFGFRGSACNGIGFIGSGTLVCDGVYVWISGRLAGRYGAPSLLQENAQLPLRQIANVESAGRVVRFQYNVEDAEGDPMCLWLADATTAARLVRVLPKRRTKDFYPRLSQ